MSCRATTKYLISLSAESQREKMKWLWLHNSFKILQIIKLQKWRTDWCKELAGGGGELGGKGHGYKRTTTGILMVTEMFYNLTVSTSITCLWYCNVILQNGTMGETVEGLVGLSIISYNCMWINKCFETNLINNLFQFFFFLHLYH